MFVFYCAVRACTARYGYYFCGDQILVDFVRLSMITHEVLYT